jgi:response regulator RpfG family c-di-GMP phosphodiesterase
MNHREPGVPVGEIEVFSLLPPGCAPRIVFVSNREDPPLNLSAHSPVPSVLGFPWKLLVVDDEPEVHLITKMVLKDYVFEGRPLKILDAASAEEAKPFLEAHPDIAVILLDVVMETEQSGLELVKWIRDELKNSLVRIILRTGQPGSAPEKQIIIDYEINDYKSKTELTSIKLFTAVTSAIRAWRDLRTIRRSKVGFQKIINASAELFSTRVLGSFIEGVLTQLTSLLNFDEESLYIQSGSPVSEGLALRNTADEYRIVAGTGSFQGLSGASLDQIPDAELRNLLVEVIAARASRFTKNYYLGYFPNAGDAQHILVLRTADTIKAVDQEIIQLFSTNVSVALENISLSQKFESSQKEIIFTLGEVLESRSKETGNHVRRVAAFSYLLAKQAGLSEGQAQTLRLASPMHDVGKIGVADSILNKPGPLTADELAEMRKHTLIGYEILRYGGSGILQTAASVALTHHERWDGQGYPQGLTGEAIPEGGRITAIADVFDALTHQRVYKAAWTVDDAWNYLRDHAGDLFEPRLVACFQAIRPQVDAILAQYLD